ncbi:hypothetical protein [Wenzhouxiangella limi]|uniref:Uncharacterized protein n=1 Tax=Wenzhouxiangella limi TaxID=2707351 RepID=A0A845V4H5_9GAMM|nr:hypothetical protein [Wenzhouxiangella limi]NDY94865.1 hypothetical protein [Wenzhouxiangella limi]
MIQIFHKHLLSTLATALIGSAAITAAGDTLAQHDQAGSFGVAGECDHWLDGRPESRVPPQCRDLAGQLNQLRQATSAFYSFDVANAAGWQATISECVESPMGGMGYHVANLEELGDPDFAATLSLLRPEVLLYAPTADGSMEFLGVEYIVPGPLSAEPPEILGQPLQFNPTLDIWALHVWIGRDNPDGIFAPFNPTVSCEFAPEPAE